MNASGHRLGNAESYISPFVATAALPYHHNSGLVFEESSDRFATQRPQLSKF